VIEEQIIAHAQAEEERESCGLVSAGKYFTCRNIALQPRLHFDIHPDDWMAAEDVGDIEAIVHSHPSGLNYLSQSDREFCVKSGLPWWLVVNGEIKKYRFMPHLIGRQFAHGVLDCYTLLRDAYHLSGHQLPEFDRKDKWWETDENLYLDNLSAHGFYRVDEAQPGDIILICLGSAKPCHAAIYIGNQYILHHRPDQLSKRDIYGGYWLKHTHSIWRYDKWLPSDLAAIFADLDASTNYPLQQQPRD